MHPGQPSPEDDDGSGSVLWQWFTWLYTNEHHRSPRRDLTPLDKKLLFLVGFFAAFAVAAVLEFAQPHSSAKLPLALRSPPWTFWRQRKHDNEMPRILLWNRATGPHSDAADFAESRPSSWWSNVTSCPSSSPAGDERWVSCEITDNRARLLWSDAVVFEAERLSAEDVPSRRVDFQTWVLWTQSHVSSVGGSSLHESRPVEARGHYHPDIGAKFDWTMGRWQRADVVTPYKSWRCGHVSPGSATTVADSARRNREALGRSAGARKDAAWIVGQREWNMWRDIGVVGLGGAEDLEREFVSVDIVPDCGRSSCGSRRECLRQIAANYRFVVVATDPDCFHSPYELIYDAFEHDLVPIVLASPRVTVEVPPLSVVSSGKFELLGTLAAFLRFLATNRVEYERYFAWKEFCSMVSSDDLCPLCLALNDKSFHGQRPPFFRHPWIERSEDYPRDRIRRPRGLDWAFYGSENAYLYRP